MKLFSLVKAYVNSYYKVTVKCFRGYMDRTNYCSARSYGVDVTKAKWSYVDWKYVVATYLLDY